MGRVVPEFRDEAVRELIIESYRLVYLYEFDEVVVVGLLHGSQDLVSRLGNNPRDRR